MTTREAERPPAGNQGAAEMYSVGGSNSTADLCARARRHDHGLLVVTGLAGGGSRARVVLTVAPAERLVENARRRGQPVMVALVRLTAIQTSPADLEALLAGVEQ